MFTGSVTKKIKRNLANLPGWYTNRKIIVFESDDWGSIRMASKGAFDFFLAKGYKVDECIYNSNDALESNDDLEALLELLSGFNDKNNNPPIFTLNQNVANPDFDKIKESDYQQYFYEPFTETLKKYPAHDKVIALYRSGIDASLIRPQFHGREHLHISNWLQALQEKRQDVLEAFEQQMFTVHVRGASNCKNEYLNTFGSCTKNDLDNFKEIISTGLDIFTELWGYQSKSFIAPCYTWPTEIEDYLAKVGVQYIQGTRVQRKPARTSSGIKKKYHYTGQKNNNGQQYLVRNVFFEPAENLNKDWVDACMREIDNAFFWHRPAIISSHRVNYIGSINPQNRSNGLKSLKLLLSRILKKYPDTEFMASDGLGDLMGNK